MMMLITTYHHFTHFFCKNDKGPSDAKDTPIATEEHLCLFQSIFKRHHNSQASQEPKVDSQKRYAF